MSKRISILAAVAAASMLAAAPTVASAEPAVDGPSASYIVQFTPGSDRAAEVSKAKALGMKVNAEYRYAISGMSVEANAGQLRALQANPNVKLVEADAIATISADQSGATWGLDRVDQRNLPLNGVYSYTQTAGNVKAYVVDTGILSGHTEFEGRVGTGFDAVTFGGSANDCHGHGTHVAGTIGGKTYGLAKAVTLVPVRVLDCTGSGTTTDILEGIDYVISDHAAGTPAVANFSLGYTGIVYSVDDAMDRLVAAGVTVAIAAGNSNVDACQVTPARAPLAVTVGSTTSSDARSSFSNYGTCLDIFAPGSSITSAAISSTTATAVLSGTSMAAPHVAGTAALYLSANATATPQQVRDALVNTGTGGKVSSAGTGSPNVLLYTGSLAPVDPSGPTITSLSPTSGKVGTPVTISGTNLTGATVTFNGTPAAASPNTDTSIATTVPIGATSGSLTVTTGSGSASTPFTVLTAPPAPANVRATAGSKGTASVSWTQSGNGGSTILKSTVTVARVFTTGPVPGPFTVMGTGTSVRISGLTKGVVYRFSVVANNGVADSSAGTSGNITAR